jgi:hypothetical protein
MSLGIAAALLPLHFSGQHGWYWTDFLTALLLLIAVAGLAIVITGRRARHCQTRITGAERTPS